MLKEQKMQYFVKFNWSLKETQIQTCINLDTNNRTLHENWEKTTKTESKQEQEKRENERETNRILREKRNGEEAVKQQNL